MQIIFYNFIKFNILSHFVEILFHNFIEFNILSDLIKILFYNFIEFNSNIILSNYIYLDAGIKSQAYQ